MYKSKLQEFCHHHTWDLPLYTTVKDGPDHCPLFTTTVTVNGLPFHSPQNACKSSKESQNLAAKLAFDYLSDSMSRASPPSPFLPRASPPSPSLPRASPPSPSLPTVVVPRASPPSPSLPTVVVPRTSPPSPSLPTVVVPRASPPSPSLPSSSAASRSSTRSGAKDVNLQQKHGENIQTSVADEISRCHKDYDLLHLYKNRLQHYAQKKSLSLPEYSCESDGPPHARQFRATVIIDGRTYQSSEYYSTLKEAEHAAAKTALESLSLVEIQEDDGLFKTLLQELTQKEGFRFPSYNTIKTGPSHMPTFLSSVEVGGETYQGGECKTKKQSEMNAAKVAYNSLMDRRMVSNPSSRSISRENIEAPSLSLQPVISDNCKHTGAETTTKTHPERAGGEIGEMNGHSGSLSPGSDRKEPSDLSSSSFNTVVTNNLLENIHPKPIHMIKENVDAEVEGDSTNAKRYRSSSPGQNVYDHLSDTFPPSLAFFDASSSHSAPSEFVKSDVVKLAGGGNPPGTKIIVFRRGSTMDIPEGASVLPCSDDKWVALGVKAELNQDQQQ